MGLIQNSIVLPTTAPFSDQKGAIHEKVKPMIEAAGASGVNVLCLQVSQSCLHNIIPIVPLQYPNSELTVLPGGVDDAICILYTGKEVV